ncbi:Calcium-binding ef-hand family protein [Thalictrum thalictroides]|uniref:Calcium-binding ef-hand family protein n=1 Tax=Thalictrum thalictroides TaxID=46969 RepID=A0A7J6VW76_THATH|nr:Calcium-binding ef-hand family protein [Thalictrum thalictroides]
MKLVTQLNPKHLFRSKKSRGSSRSVSRSDPFSSTGSSSSSSDGSSTNLKEIPGSTTPNTVLPSRYQFLHSKSIISSDTDSDAAKTIPLRQLETLLRRVGASEEEIAMMLIDDDVVDHEQEGSTDAGGCVSLAKFGEMSSAFGPACDTEIRDTFDFFDVDRDGKISAEELLGVFSSIGDNQCTLEDCQRMIAGVDSNGDGFVCFEDFTRMMEHQRC